MGHNIRRPIRSRKPKKQEFLFPHRRLLTVTSLLIGNSVSPKSYRFSTVKQQERKLASLQ